MNPFSDKPKNVPVSRYVPVSPYADDSYAEIEIQIIDVKAQLDSLKRESDLLKSKDNKLRNEVVRRLQAEKLKSYKGEKVSFTVTTRKKVIIEENEQAVEFATDKGFMLNKIDTKELEKVLDKDNLPEWARISVSSSLAVKARTIKKEKAGE